ncbi:MAG: alpha/beta hydrolase [Sulfitobacter sp.]
MAGVYRGMSQAMLETQYDARGSVADFPAEMDTYSRLSAVCYNACAVTRDLAYGPSQEERIDFFPASTSDAPVFVYFHGGYWRALGRRESAFMVESLVANGVSVAVVEYALAPAVTLDIIVDQTRRATAYIYENADKFGIDLSRLFIGGSSAGAQLSAMVLSTDWASQFGIAEKPVRGALLASGLYDLEPVSLCAPNAWLNLDASAVARNSPIHHLPKHQVDILLTWGGLETDEFKRQSMQYAKTLQAAEFTPRIMPVGDRNHFDIIIDLNDPARMLFRTLMQMISES